MTKKRKTKVTIKRKKSTNKKVNKNKLIFRVSKYKIKERNQQTRESIIFFLNRTIKINNRREKSTNRKINKKNSYDQNEYQKRETNKQ